MSPTGGRAGGRSLSFTGGHRKVMDLKIQKDKQTNQIQATNQIKATNQTVFSKPKSVHSILHVGFGHDSVALQRHWHLQHTINLRPLRTSPDWMPISTWFQLFFHNRTPRMKLFFRKKKRLKVWVSHGACLKSESASPQALT